MSPTPALFLSPFLFFFLGTMTWGTERDLRPNILLIMVDDLGYADFGCYGGEIETPHIDALAEGGLRFTQFYNTAKCHSSRVSLLTGLYCEQAGSSSLSRATTVAEVAAKAGYATSMSGKWHLHKNPLDFGFERYWGHLSGAADFFVGNDSFRFGREVWNEFEGTFYATDAIVDFSFEFLDESIASGKPFLHYIAFNAPHYPLQAKKEDILKYRGRYEAGWEVIRAERFAKQQALGLFPEEMKLPPMPNHVPSWESLSQEQQEFESFRMAVYAAMVDSLDQNLGRLVAYLREQGVYENTLIMLLSDNGACPFDRTKRMEHAAWEGQSHLCYSASWATVGNTPFKHYKQTQHEGGISTPFIAHWPLGIQTPGASETEPSHLIDVMATVLELSGGIYPQDAQVEPLQGKTLVPFFRGQDREPHEELFFQFSSCRALRQGDWKLVSFYGHRWELYDLAEDRVEQVDLAAEQPERVASMAARWHEIASGKGRVSARHREPVNESSWEGSWNGWHRPGTSRQWERP
ncbi:MAG: arylsulfatase [Verrucomicrobiota bacterium]